ncbi:MAG TPA: aminotransferase class V-fold PLP-dependent enzyme [Candidatus Dormibacteraeota bacterium]|nr:aminotransferase class V-fold PLP-dependent enzyme [Candidatus Dormibacteraeota bacterium]
MYHSGRHFLQIPGPTNVPDRVLRAMDRPVIDHRSKEFSNLGKEVLEGMKEIFQTTSPVIIYPGSGTGGWEAAIANTLSPGDRVLMAETGFFSEMWRKVAEGFGIEVDYLPSNWRRGADPAEIEARLKADSKHEYKAVLVVHNETSTGVTSRIDEVRRAIDRAGHPALLLVDAVSSLACIDYRHDEWGVDVSVAGSQKGLMLPPGLAINAISEKALAASKTAKSPRSYWDWNPMLGFNPAGFFPYTPATNHLYGLREALAMLREEGLPNVFRRHDRHARAARAAVQAWGLEMVCEDPQQYSRCVTAVFTPAGYDADRFREIVRERFDMSLGGGMGQLKGKAFRIGHLGSFNDLMLAGTLCGIEMGLHLTGIPTKASGVTAALQYLAESSSTESV